VVPKEIYGGESQPMEPYYILMKLPGSDELQYLLMTPFTRQNRDNMISWMAAKCDFPEYARMLFYQLPKEKLIYAPNQIEAMIDQNTTISQQLTLWDQKGSRVIRGKQIVTPIENSFLYVVPVYLQAEGTNFPQLKRVIGGCGRQGCDGAHARRGGQRPFRYAATSGGVIAARHPAAGLGPGENPPRGRPEGNAAGGLGKIWNGDGGARTPASRAGSTLGFDTTYCRLAERLSQWSEQCCGAKGAQGAFYPHCCTGFRRRSSIISKMRRNSSRGTATSAIWNMV
jgi:Uncharacterised protein family (UPF0182)